MRNEKREVKRIRIDANVERSYFYFPINPLAEARPRHAARRAKAICQSIARASQPEAQSQITNQKSEIPALKPEAVSQGVYSKANFEIARIAGDSSRYTLGAILVTPTETIATDGFRLLRVSTVNSKIKLTDFPQVPGCEVEAARFLMPRAAALDMSKAFFKRQSIPVLNYAAPLKPIRETKSDKRTVGFVTTDLERHNAITSAETPGQFPNVDAVMPRETPLATISLNASQLKDMANFFTKLDAEARCPSVKITLYPGFGPVKFEGKNEDNGQTAVGLLMPVGD